MKRLIILFFLLAGFFCLLGQDAGSSEADDLLDRARDSVRRESYPSAMEILKEGQELFPEDYRFPLMLGEVLTGQELYNLALESFQRADSVSPENRDVMTAMADVYGRLNMNRESVGVLERILELYPDSPETASDLGWMYFKTYRPADGEELLIDTIAEFGETPGLLMTLGTIYTGLYDYEKAKDYYQRSIDAADQIGWDYFSSVAYYNMALLDMAFYHYEESMEEASKSLETARRSSGYICLGELAMSRMDFPAAVDAFEQAYNIDETPLSLLSQARLYYEFGLLDQALSHTKEAAERSDSSWMYYFGVDTDRHLMDIYELYADIYESKSRAEARRPVSGSRRIKALAGAVKYRVLGWYYRNAWRKLSLKVGNAYLAEGNNFDAELLFCDVLENYPDQALKYLLSAEKFEVNVAPESYPFYRYEEGRLKKDPDILRGILDDFDPVWEKGALDDVLTSLVPLLKGADKYNALNLLFGINPGSFIREGFDLPLVLSGNINKRFVKMLDGKGLEFCNAGTDGINYQLRMDLNGSELYFSLWDLLEDRTLWTEKTVLEGETDYGEELAAEAVINRLFRPR